jgi:hypothetical protein
MKGINLNPQVTCLDSLQTMLETTLERTTKES